MDLVRLHPRSIPAWAGEPSMPITGILRTFAGSIPAWAGEPLTDWYGRSPICGLSPRGRGNLVRLAAAWNCLCRSIPAWAGEPVDHSRCRSIFPDRVYPRVGGGTRPGQADYPARPALRYGLSPRGRGNRRCWDGEYTGSRSIPAWAGEPSCTARSPFQPGVYPRVGGGTAMRHGRQSG